MSHVDDGTLHAYVDGELAPVERERVDRHLAGCPPCRTRLDEARALVERAARLLELAVPPAPHRAPPPLHSLRQRPVWWRLRAPLAWAATVVLAVGLGWVLRGRTVQAPRQIQVPVVLAPAPNESAFRSPAATPLTVAESPSHAKARAQSPGPLAPSGAAADRADQPSLPPAAAKAAPPAQLAQLPASAEVRGEVASAQHQIVVVPSVAEETANAVYRERLTSTWTVIEPQTARQLLGTEPVTIPGHSVRALRQGPASEVLVEQDLGNGVVVMLFERSEPIEIANGMPRREVTPNDTAGAPAVGAALMRRDGLAARVVGPLLVHIAGPLPADSLARLLLLVR
jgi:hypothetical protein